MIVGHFTAAVAVYLNHRFVFHGFLGKLPVLRQLRKLHCLHHAHAYDNQRNNYFEPIWVRALFFVVIGLFGFYLSWAFSFGLLTYGIFYYYRHKAIHNYDFTSNFSLHHEYHHKKNPFTNFSGIYPFIDRIFGTMAEQQNL